MARIEICCRDSRVVRLSFNWKENGRVYSLVCRENEVGRFLSIVIKDVERKRFRVFIP